VKLPDPSIVLSAARRDNLEVMLLLIKSGIANREVLADAALLAQSFDRPEMLKAIMDNADIGSVIRDQILPGAITRGQVSIVRLFIPSMSSERLEQALMTAARENNADVFQLLLEESPVDININLSQLIIASSPELKYNKKLVDRLNEQLVTNKKCGMGCICEERISNMIALSNKLDMDAMSREQTRLLIWSILNHVRDRIDGLIAGNVNLTRSQLDDLIVMGDDHYSSLLRFVVIKRPTSRQVMDWFTKHGDTNAIEAVRSVSMDTLPKSGRAIPFAALMYVMELRRVISSSLPD